MIAHWPTFELLIAENYNLMHKVFLVLSAEQILEKDDTLTILTKSGPHLFSFFFFFIVLVITSNSNQALILNTFT